MRSSANKTHTDPVLFGLALACLLLLGGLPGSGLAQDQDRYLVEVIVFSRPALRTSYYRWPGEPDMSSAVEFSPVAPEAESEPSETVFGDAASRRFRGERPAWPTPLIPEEPAFAPADPPDYALTEDWRRLDERPEFEPLVHLAWRQPAASFGEPQPVRVHGGGVVERRQDQAARLLLGPDRAPRDITAVDGTVALERGRFLHLRVDLVLRAPAREGHGHPLDSLTAENTASYFTFRLSERRQIQTGTVHYFDHERFGLIALVKEWQEVDPAPSF